MRGKGEEWQKERNEAGKNWRKESRMVQEVRRNVKKKSKKAGVDNDTRKKSLERCRSE